MFNFTILNEYFKKLINTYCDLKCKNLTRISFLAYDPKAIFYPKATPFYMELQTNVISTYQRAEELGSVKLFVAFICLFIDKIETYILMQAKIAYNELLTLAIRGYARSKSFRPRMASFLCYGQ